METQRTRSVLVLHAVDVGGPVNPSRAMDHFHFKDKLSLLDRSQNQLID